MFNFRLCFGKQLVVKLAEYQSQLTYPVVENTHTGKHRHKGETARGEAQSSRRRGRNLKNNKSGDAKLMENRGNKERDNKGRSKQTYKKKAPTRVLETKQNSKDRLVIILLST